MQFVENLDIRLRKKFVPFLTHNFKKESQLRTNFIIHSKDHHVL